ncbi:hypothetical protein RHGRI_000851 [Rhododendron griersonianum]|uniref:Protein FAR1-RELATED SEQUENCE n=1 Tax=Rhododendron griersonianum TaxID=479676 RepID=A0AAV6LJ98_9ERIC|nr:hypothetical protein RHGRI_000851 [Rhododendron griersonianum]
METSIASSPSIGKEEVLDPESSMYYHWGLDGAMEEMDVDKEDLGTDVVDGQSKSVQEGDTSTHGSHVGPSTNTSTNTTPTPVPMEYDVTKQFTTSQLFSFDEHLVEWTRGMGKRHGFVIIIMGLEKLMKNRKPRMRFACERSGKYRKYVKKSLGEEVVVKKRERSTGTKKCECPFELKAVKGDDGWTLSVHNGTHNHPPVAYLEGHSYAGRLTFDEISTLVDLKMFDDKTWEEFSCSWGLVVLSTSAEQYEERLRALKRDFKMVPAALEYLEKNWLEPYKERFVGAWTDNIMHFGNLTINRAESAHAKLKHQLKHSQCNFDGIWEKIHRLILLQETEVRGSFEKSLTCMQHDFRIPLFDSLRGVVSKNGMTLVLVASRQVQWLVESNIACGCALRKTHGLPCAHEIAPYKTGNISIPLDLIHDHWKRLSLLPSQVDGSLGETVKADFEIFYNRFMNESHAGQIHLASKLKEVFHPECITLLEPKQKVKTRGCPSTKEKNAKKVKNATKVRNSTHRDPLEFEHVLASLEKNGNPNAVKKTPRRNPKAQLVAPQASLQSVEDVNDKPRCNPKVQVVAPQASLQSMEGVKGKLQCNPTAQHVQAEASLQFSEVVKGKRRCNPRAQPVAPQASLQSVDDVNQKSRHNSRAKAKVAHASTSDFINQFPEAIRPYIESVKNVESDGKCGFRSISAFMKEDCGGEHGWKEVRKDLLQELDTNFSLYEKVAATTRRAWELHFILNCSESPAPTGKWMTMPDMGHLIASTYNCVLVHLSKNQCLMFLPLRSKPLPSMRRKVIAIGFVDGGHSVFLKNDSPMPPIACNWTIFHDHVAKNWGVPYAAAIKKFNEIIGNDVATKEVIDVD